MNESPKNYTITIFEEWLPMFQNLASGRKIGYKVLSTEPDATFAKVTIEVTAPDDQTLFDLGFWFERVRDQDQKKHYDLNDITKVEVEVPAGFLLICNYFQLNPSSVLALFAGDLSLHPFITGGSDERWMAKDYFLRGYHAPLDDEDKVGELFDDLELLRRSWGGNKEMDAFKKMYAKELKKLSKKYPGKEVKS